MTWCMVNGTHERLSPGVWSTVHKKCYDLVCGQWYTLSVIFGL